MPAPQKRKQTAWKKSRKFGDLKGGRMRPKLADNVFSNQHNLLAPTMDEDTPVYMVDNPSRDFYFPVTVKEVKQVLSKLPSELTRHLTHIWLRKRSKKREVYQGAFICGSGVQLIVMYAFPKDLMMRFGEQKPSKSTLTWYAPYKPELIRQENKWFLKWSEEGIRNYYLKGLLLHEIGHKADSYYKRYWSPAYAGKAEKFANNFAYYWADELRTAYE